MVRDCVCIDSSSPGISFAMADYRLVQPAGPRLWLIMGGLAVAGLIAWSMALLVGDPTAPEEQPRVGAAANFGASRPPVIPVEAVPFGSVTPIQTRDRGRYVRVSGVAESRVAANSLWVRTQEGYRVLVRFEPEPARELLRGINAGAAVSFNGYLQNIARAELRQILDSLNVRLPRPPPARKFGDLPDPGFARVDSLLIKEYYVSVRPEGIRPSAPPQTET
jgi:hypothetical protein